MIQIPTETPKNDSKWKDVFVGEGKDFTAVQKRNIMHENMKNNVDVVKLDLSAVELVQPQKSTKGVTPLPYEWQIDHMNAKNNGRTNSYNNERVLSRSENKLKWTSRRCIDLQS